MKGIIFSSFFFLSVFTYACDCPPIPDLSRDVLKQYDVIFKGKVDSIVRNKTGACAWFSIDELYHGNSARTVAVYFEDLNSCRLEFARTDEWLMYTQYLSFGKLKVNFCSRSRKYFTTVADDFYQINNRMSYKDEIDFLSTNVGVQQLMEQLPSEGIQTERENIHPSQMQVLIWLIASVMGFLGIYFLVTKYLK